MVNIVVEDITFPIDITDKEEDHTCGWLMQEVHNKYTQLLLKQVSKERKKFTSAGGN